jgi:hypothetical protein
MMIREKMDRIPAEAPAIPEKISRRLPKDVTPETDEDALDAPRLVSQLDYPQRRNEAQVLSVTRFVMFNDLPRPAPGQAPQSAY